MQLFDLLGQAACILGSGPLASGSGNGLGSFFFASGFGTLFLLGGWQLMSALLHLLVWKRIEGRKQARRLHLIIVGILAVFFAIAFLGKERWNELGDTFLLTGFSALFLGPVLACLYFCITALDLWKMAVATLPGATLKSRPVVLQPLLVLLVLITPFTIQFLEVYSYTLYLWGAYFAVLGLAGWLAVDYLTARNTAQASRWETVCAVWAVGSLCLTVAVFFFSLPISYNLFGIGILLNPATALTVWFAAALWRGPLREPVGPIPEL